MKKLLGTLAIMTTLALAAPAAQAQMCTGTVHGLSGHYNPATGAGFLAVRAGPHRAATQVGELFNGDQAEIFRRKGSWYKIASFNGLEGWVHRRYLYNDCGY